MTRYVTSTNFDIVSVVQALQERVEQLSTVVKLPYSSVDDGALTVTNASGTQTMQIGKQFDNTFVAAPLVGPIPPIPTTPIVTPTMGGLKVRWDGAFSFGEVAPMDFSRVEVHVSTTNNFDATTAATQKGSIESPRGGEIVIAPLPSSVHYVKLVTRSAPGNASAASAQASATPDLVSVTKLTSGSLQPGVVITAGTVGNNAGRVEIDGNGVRLIFRNGSGVDTTNVNLDTATGQGTFKGTVTSSTVTGTTINGGTIDGTTVTGVTVSGSTVSGTTITGGTITGSTFKTASTGERWEIVGSANAREITAYSNAVQENIPGKLIAYNENRNTTNEVALIAIYSAKMKATGTQSRITMGSGTQAAPTATFINMNAATMNFSSYPPDEPAPPAELTIARDYVEMYGDLKFNVGTTMGRIYFPNSIRWEGAAGNTYVGLLSGTTAAALKVRSLVCSTSYLDNAPNAGGLFMEGLADMVGTHNNTATFTANVGIATAPLGRLYRITSSQRYKVGIRPETILDDAVMSLVPKSYVDKRQFEDAATPDKQTTLPRYLGLIAEDVAATPLGPLLVTNNEQGQPDAVSYDRLAVALLPAIQRLITRVAKIEGVLATLTPAPTPPRK